VQPPSTYVDLKRQALKCVRFIMKTRIIRIGNSQGIRISKPLLEQTGLKGDVEICPHKDGLLIRRTAKARAGWAARLRQMARTGDDSLLDETAVSLSSWDEEEWTWD
jgi:antitoxin MazE